MVPDEPAGVAAADLLPEIGDYAAAFETRQTQALEETAFAELRTEHKRYFDALRMQPRQLVGQKVPSTTGDGEETIKDSQDAKDWQETVKGLLVEAATAKVEASKDDLAELNRTVHSSIALFQNNVDLIPTAAEFNKDLANAFAEVAKDYEVRSNGKLIGYSVPTQPIINGIRSQMTARATAAAIVPPAATPSPAAARAAEQPRQPNGQWDGPQAGIRSSAGQSAPEGSDDASGVLAAFYRQNGLSL